MKHRIARHGALVALITITLLVGRPALGAATEEQLPTATPTATAAANATQTQTATLPPSATAEPTSTSQPTTTATPGANARPDDCEKNNRREAACPIAIDTVNGPFTFIRRATRMGTGPTWGSRTACKPPWSSGHLVSWICWSRSAGRTVRR